MNNLIKLLHEWKNRLYYGQIIITFAGGKILVEEHKKHDPKKYNE